MGTTEMEKIKSSTGNGERNPGALHAADCQSYW